MQLDGLIDTYCHQQVRRLASLSKDELTEQEIVQQRTLTQQGEGEPNIP